MEIISFDVSGKFAHFRKFYANNTALSYSIPPRTTIIGMLAALLGKEKDSYYRSMNSGKIRVGVRILCPLKKSFHRLNLLKIKGPSDFRGKQGIIQTPFEIVSGINIGADEIRYRMYVSCFEEGKELFDELKGILLQRIFTYNLTLGAANFSASVYRVRVYGEDEFELAEDKEGYSYIHSAICSAKVKRVGFEKNQKLLIEEELIPCDFVDDDNRELSAMHRIIYSIDGQSTPMILEGRYYKLLSSNEPEHITFIE